MAVKEGRPVVHDLIDQLCPPSPGCAGVSQGACQVRPEENGDGSSHLPLRAQHPCGHTHHALAAEGM